MLKMCKVMSTGRDQGSKELIPEEMRLKTRSPSKEEHLVLFSRTCLDVTSKLPFSQPISASDPI